MTHDPKLSAAIDAAILEAIQKHDLDEHGLYMMGSPDPSEDRAILATAALDAIEAQGWVVVKARAQDEALTFEAGQLWVPSTPKAKPRTVTKIGPHRSYPSAGDRCVFFTIQDQEPGPWPHVLRPETFKRWVEKNRAMVAARPGANPQESTPCSAS